MRARSPSFSEDERRVLLPPPGTQTPQAQPGPAIDHQKLKERLGTIVRSKEGKMINVGTPLPFNLHNKALHARIDPSGSASSRSGARSPSGSSGGQRRSTADGEPERSSSRASSPQPPSSPSIVSLQPGDASYLPPEERYNGNRPILNVRLVSDGNGRARKGRSRGRLGRFGEERGREIKRSNGRANPKEDEASPPKFSSSAPSSSASPPTKNKPPTFEESPPNVQKNFKIQDVGAIARSWRD